MSEPIKFAVDHDYSPQLGELAAQLEHIGPTPQRDIENLIEGDKHPEFYNGLLSAYANVLAMLDQAPIQKHIEALHVIVAVLASRIRKEQSGQLPDWNGDK